MTQDPTDHDDDTVYAALTTLMRDVFDDDTVVATPTLDAEAVEAWDSVAHVRLLVGVEEAFGFRFTTAEIDALRRVGDIVAVVKARKQA